MEKKWTDDAWDGYQNFINTNKALLKKVNDILKDIERNGENIGIAHPEPLKGNFSGFYSREIDKKNRIVYKIENATLIIIQCGTHYKDK